MPSHTPAERRKNRGKKKLTVSVTFSGPKRTTVKAKRRMKK